MYRLPIWGKIPLWVIGVKKDLIVIGGGSGGYVAAIRAAQLGLDVLLVERDPVLGGTCLNRGCIPTKALLHAASLLGEIKRADVFGIDVPKVSLDMGKLQEWKGKVVNRLVQGVQFLLERNGVQVVQGEARFVSRDTVRIAGPDMEVRFRWAIIATGSVPAELSGFPFDGERILSSREALELRVLPEELLVIGGGYIGLELATFFAKAGSRVTVVEVMDHVLPGVDPELVRFVVRKLKALGVKILTGCKACDPQRIQGGLAVAVEGQGIEGNLEVEKVLVCVGRRPYTKGLGLDVLGLETDRRGFLPVGKDCRTEVPGILAVGDVAGEPMLAHKAHFQGKVAAAVAAGGEPPPQWRAMPAAIFTDPEIAVVGLSESKAREQGHEVVLGRFPFTASGRAVTLEEAQGLVKVIGDKDTGKLLGVGIVGPWASELVGEASLAISRGLTLEEFAAAIRPHPTLSESLMEAAEAALGRAIHALNP